MNKLNLSNASSVQLGLTNQLCKGGQRKSTGGGDIYKQTKSKQKIQQQKIKKQKIKKKSRINFAKVAKEKSPMEVISTDAIYI